MACGDGYILKEELGLVLWEVRMNSGLFFHSDYNVELTHAHPWDRTDFLYGG